MNLEKTNKSIHESEAIIKGNENLIGMGFWNIGNELKVIKETKSYEEKGYSSFESYIEQELKYGKTQTYGLISIAEKYSVQSTERLGSLGITKLLSLTSLDEEERESFIKENPVEDMTTRELAKAIKEKKELEERAIKAEREVEELKNQEPTVIETEVEKTVLVVPEDYDRLKLAEKRLEQQIQNLEDSMKGKVSPEDYNKIRKEYSEKVSENHELKKQIEQLVQVDSKVKHQEKLKDSALIFCTRIHTFLNDVGGLAWLTEYLDELDDYDKRSYYKALDLLEGWVFTVKSNINREEF